MKEPSLMQRIARKGSDPVKLAEFVMQSPSLVKDVLEGMSAAKPAIKYQCEKIIRVVSERQPDLLYPHFAFFTSLLDCDNSILKWGAIRILANLAQVDVENKVDPILDRYVSTISGPVMISAATTIGGCATIAIAKPHLAARMAKEILKVEDAEYKTRECRNVAIGHAIDSLARFFEYVPDPVPVIQFVKKQLGNNRSPVRKRAERFLKRLGASTSNNRSGDETGK